MNVNVSVNVDLEEYARLLGYPAGRELQGPVLERAREAIGWYARSGRPVAYVRDGVAAFTAGVEVEREVARRWEEGRVDEAYFLDRLAASVVEAMASEHPHQSPGTGSVPLSEQRALYERLGSAAPVEMLPSGMLRPVHSLLALLTDASTGLTSCSSCDFRCSFRRRA